MSTTLILWTTLAVSLFWFVGAYNRLVRQRSEVNTAFAALEIELSKQVALVRSCLPAGDDSSPAVLEGDNAFWSGLQGAAAQFAVSLAAARARPLAPEGIAALCAAQDVLASAWERAERDDAHDLAGSRLPETVTTTRAVLSGQSGAAARQFNLAVSRYNAAIGQFPALLLAWLFGFKAGREV